MEANQQLLRCTEEGTAQAQRLFEEVIALEPDFSRGYSGLALCYAIEANVRGRGSAFYNEQRARAIDLAQKALSLNETDAINHAVLAYLFALTKQHDKAVVHAERALALEANSFLVLELFGLCPYVFVQGQGGTCSVREGGATQSLISLYAYTFKLGLPPSWPL